MSATEEVATRVSVCSKCQEHPRAAEDGTNPWCKACRAKYAKEYRDGLAARQFSYGFIKGIEAMRERLMREFTRLGSGSFTGDEISYLIAGMTPPVPSGD